MRRGVILALVSVFVLAGCNREAQLDVSVTTSTPSTTSGSSTTVAAMATPDYEIVYRSSNDAGEILHIVIPPNDYSDRDLENLVAAVVDDHDGLAELQVFDDAAAEQAFRTAESDRTPDEVALLEAHYLVSLEANRITFQGPFSDMGSFVFGS